MFQIRIDKEERERLKAHLEDYLISQGWNLRGNVACPNAIEHKNGDKTPSATFYRDTNLVYCHKCKRHFTLFKYITVEEAFALYGDKTKTNYKKGDYKTMTTINNTLPTKEKQEIDYTNDFIQWNKALLENEQGLNYLSSRGISKETAERLNLGYNKQFNSIVFPKGKFSYNSRLITPIDDKHRFHKKGNSNLFNKSALFNNKNYCFIAESEFDCLSFEELGYNAIGLAGVGDSNKVFKEDLQQEKIYIIALDNDEAGQKETAEMIIEFKARNLRCLAFNWCVPYKDPNEYLTTDKEGFKLVCESVLDNFDKLIEEQKSEEQKEQEIKELEELKEYNLNNNLSKLDKLNKFIKDTENFRPYTTGFTTIDNCLCGGLHSELMIIGAPSSTGKTTFILQMADNIAKNGQDVMFFSLEMPELELMCKSLSRLSHLNDNTRRAKTMDDILYGYHYKHYSEQEIQAIEECKKEYATFAENLFFREFEAEDNILKIKTEVSNHIRIRKKKPVVFIDYLQILPSRDERADIRKAMNDNISDLKRITRELNVPIVAISSVNRQSYEEIMSMDSFKESGNIEFGADILCGLQFTEIGAKDINELKQESPRKVTFSIIKYRNGMTGKGINFDYIPKYNYFVESENCAFNLRDSKPKKYDQQSKKKNDKSESSFPRRKDTSLFQF